MTITITPIKMTQEQANWCYDVAKTYLEQSDLASFIIEELEAIDELLTIEVSTSSDDGWAPPDDDDDDSAGTIEWNVTQTLDVVDKKDDRPDVNWTSKIDADVVATISPALALIHELGHAMQFMTNKQAFRDRLANLDDEDVLLDIENTNVNTIENTVALELIEKGNHEGVRWDYHATK